MEEMELGQIVGGSIYGNISNEMETPNHSPIPVLVDVTDAEEVEDVIIQTENIDGMVERNLDNCEPNDVISFLQTLANQVTVLQTKVDKLSSDKLSSQKLHQPQERHRNAEVSFARWEQEIRECLGPFCGRTAADWQESIHKRAESYRVSAQELDMAIEKVFDAHSLHAHNPGWIAGINSAAALSQQVKHRGFLKQSPFGTVLALMCEIKLSEDKLNPIVDGMQKIAADDNAVHEFFLLASFFAKRLDSRRFTPHLNSIWYDRKQWVFDLVRGELLIVYGDTSMTYTRNMPPLTQEITTIFRQAVTSLPLNMVATLEEPTSRPSSLSPARKVLKEVPSLPPRSPGSTYYGSPPQDFAKSKCPFWKSPQEVGRLGLTDRNKYHKALLSWRRQNEPS